MRCDRKTSPSMSASSSSKPSSLPYSSRPKTPSRWANGQADLARVRARERGKIWVPARGETSSGPNVEMTWTQWKRNQRRRTRLLRHHRAMRPPRMASSHPVRSPISPRWTSTLSCHKNPLHTKAINSSQNSGRVGCVRVPMTASVNSMIFGLSTHRPSRTTHSIHNSRSSQRSLTQQRMRARKRYPFRLHRR